MKKQNVLLLLLTFSSLLAKAQYFEGFEDGVPGSMLQTYTKGNTTWINYGLSALNVEAPLAEKNSAVFFNAMETKVVSTSLQTPILDLTEPKMFLEFKYLQRQKTENYANELAVEISIDGGQTWREIAVYKETTKDMKTIRISLAPFSPSARSCVKFISTQFDNKKGFPIVIDDISLKVATKTPSSIGSISEIELFPNPSTGLFTLSTDTPVDVSVYDTNGRNVYTGKSLTNSVIDLTLFPQGVYIAKIKGVDCLEVKKIIIQ